MALLVEDGSLVAGANSYITLLEARTFATDTNEVPEDSDQQLEANLRLAMRFIESHRNGFKGNIVNRTQALQWPRSNVFIDGFLFDFQSIPQELKDLQSQLSVEIKNGVVLFQTVTEPFVVESAVGSIKEKIDPRYGTGTVAKMPQVEVFFDVLLSSSAVLEVIRF